MPFQLIGPEENGAWWTSWDLTQAGLCLLPSWQLFPAPHGGVEKICLLVSDIFPAVLDRGKLGSGEEYQISYSDLRSPSLQQTPHQGLPIP